MGSALFWEGYDAMLKGIADSDCPYPLGSGKRRDWLEGWHDEIMFEFIAGVGYDKGLPGDTKRGTR